MARADNATLSQIRHPRDTSFGFSQPQIPPNGVVEAPSVAGGMVNRVPRDQVPINSWRLGKNTRSKDFSTIRRPGTSELGTEPDSNKVIRLVSYIKENGDIVLVRFTQSTAHIWNGGSWLALTINDGGFNGASNRLDVDEFLGKLYIADYIDRLWELNFDSKEINSISAAPRAKFCMAFADRIVAANVRPFSSGPRPHQIHWSVNGDPTDWTGTGSGFTDLFATDLGNEITGLFGLEDIGVVLRRKTIVHMSRQPFALNPFSFRTIIHEVGCDLPFSAAKVPNAIIFADSRTREVYLYSPGSLPTPLGAKLNRELFSDLANPDYAEGVYDPYEKEYHLGLVWSTNNGKFTRTWVYNLETQSWNYDDGPAEVTAISAAVSPNDFTTIDELSGTINALSGSIDELGGDPSVLSPSVFKGTSDGKVIQFDSTVTNDYDGTAFEAEWDSINLGSLSRRRTLKEVNVTCEIPVDGSVTIESSRDESTWLQTKTESKTGGSGVQYVRLTRQDQLVGNDLYFRIKTTARNFKILSWWAALMEQGVQMGDQQ